MGVIILADKKEAVAKKGSTGLQPNVAAMLCYVAGWVTGLIFLLVEKQDKFVRFHAMQSLMAFGVLTIVPFVPVIGWILSPFMAVLGFVVWVVCLYNAYQGKEFRLPVVGELAKKQLAKMG